MAETIKQVIQFEARGADQVESDARQLASAFTQIDRAAEAAGSAGKSAGSALEGALSGASSEARDLVDQLKLAEAQARDLQSASSRGGRGGQSSTDRIDRASRFGTQIAGGLGGGEVGNAVGLVGDLADSLGTLGPVGVVATGAIAGLTAGIEALNGGARDAIRFFQAGITAQAQYYDAVENLTAEEARQRIAENERANESIRRQANNLQAVLEGLGYSGAGATALNALAGLNNEFAQAVVQVQGAQTELNNQLNTNIQLNTRLEQGLAAGAFAANTAAAAEEELAQARMTVAQRQAGLITSFLNLTAEQAEQKRQELLTQFQQTQDLIYSGLFSPETTAQLKTQLRGLSEQILILTQTSVGAAAAVGKTATVVEGLGHGAGRLAQLMEDQERADKLAADKRKKYMDAIKDTAKAADEVAKAQQDVADIESKQAAERKQKFDDYAIESTRQQEDLQDDLLKIQRDAADDMRDAVGSRDALAFVQAKRNRDKELREAQDAAGKEARRRRQDFDRALRDQASAAQRELSLKNQALQIANANLAAAKRAELSIYDGVFSNTLTKASTWSINMQALFHSAFSGYGTKAAPATPLLGGSKAVTINLAGATSKQINTISRQQVFDTLNDLLGYGKLR